MKKILIIFLLFQTPAYSQNLVNTYFAGGCFWCMEESFEKIEGVIEVISGYSGGTTENPTYKEVTYSDTGHFETIKITYDSEIINYKKILDFYWKNIDPFDAYGQFCDKGPHYRAAIFIMNSEEKRLAIKSRATLQDKLKNKVVTEILSAKQFYPAEDYHQNYYKKNPIRYKYYRYGCNRDKRLNQIEELINSK